MSLWIVSNVMTFFVVFQQGHISFDEKGDRSSMIVISQHFSGMYYFCFKDYMVKCRLLCQKLTGGTRRTNL